MTITERHRDLVDLFSNDQLSKAEFEELQQALREHSALRRYLAEYRSMESGLSKVAQYIDIQSDHQPVPAKPNRPTPLALILTSCVILLTLLAIIGSFTAYQRLANNTEISDDGIGQITKVLDVTGAVHQELIRGVVSPGPVAFDTGVIEIEFFSGARTLVKGPAKLDLISSDEMVCHEGVIRGYAPPHARGFRIRSSKMELIDLGTEFGVSVSSTGAANIKVFDGEVEVYNTDSAESKTPKRLKAGDSLSIGSEAVETIFPKFEEAEAKAIAQSEQRYINWKKWQSKLLNDPRLSAYLDFENPHTSYSVIGCEKVEGRWPKKSALGFKTLGDRVRVDLPNELSEFTVSTWMRMDARPTRPQAILMTDGAAPFRLHWQTSIHGEQSIGIKQVDSPLIKSHSPVLFTPRRIGVWNQVAIVRKQKEIIHYFNGKKVSRQKTREAVPFRIGPAQIGNWAADNHKNHIRNLVGKMDEMIIWNAALSEAEVRENYRNSKP